ncbi:Nucleolar complex protein 2-like protein, partial [Fragariocoptes setiger]
MAKDQKYKVRKKNKSDKIKTVSLMKKARQSGGKFKIQGKAKLRKILDSLKEEVTLAKAHEALETLPSFLKFRSLTKQLLKIIIKSWSHSAEKIKVVDLLIIIRIFRQQNSVLKAIITKKMYRDFVAASKNVNVHNLASVNFMRGSLVELYSLDHKIAHDQANMFCRHLASMLKDAFENSAKTEYKSIMNWQFVNQLTLWALVIAKLMPSSVIEPLINPIVQLHYGSLALINSPNYYPFYCHIISNLVEISKSLEAYVPVLPFAVSLLTRIKPPSVEKKIKDKSRIKSSNNSKIDIEDSGADGKKENKFNFDLLVSVVPEKNKLPAYTHAASSRLCDLIVDYLDGQCNRVTFPEICLLAKIQIKKYIKLHKQTEVAQRLRKIVEAMEADIKHVEGQRQTIQVDFSNLPAIASWEREYLQNHHPSIRQLRALAK